MWRLAVNIGYYETFNRDNVNLVDLEAEPIVRFDPTSIRTTHSHFDLDLVVFALSFEACRGSIDAAASATPRARGPPTSGRVARSPTWAS